MKSDQHPAEQACAIPFRWLEESVEFCLITSTSGKWLFPKGFVDPGETLEAAALREALEEAGIRGHIHGEPLGRFGYDKQGQSLVITVVLMEVTVCESEWEEANKRDRRWVPSDDAADLLSQDELCLFVDAALERIASH